MEKYLARNWFCCGFIGLFAMLLWGQTVRYDFVWDDGLYITLNKSIRSLDSIPKYFYRNDVQSAESPSLSYRPIRNTVHTLLFAMEGNAAPQPWLFHLANILCNAVVSILLFLVALLLCERLKGGDSTPARVAALLIALGFAAHPVISEAVCWAKSLEDLLAAAFVLAATRSLLKWNGGGPGCVAAVIWYLLAVFSKESAVPFAPAAFFILVGFHKLPWRRSALLVIPFFAVAFLYVVCRHFVMGRFSQCPPLSGSYGQTLVDMLPIAPEYLRLLLGLPPFCADYNFMVGAPPHPFFSGAVLGGVFVVLFFSALTVWLWRREKWRLSAFGLIWAAVFLVPVSNLVPMMQFMADRFLYLPLMGFLMALGGVFLILSRCFRVATLAAAALILIWAGTSLNRMTIWHDDLTLFVRTELEHPGIKRVEKNAVAAVFRLPQITNSESAKTLTPAQAAPIIATLERARQIYPENDQLTTQLGFAEAKVGHWQRAVGLLELAARQNPGLARRWFYLASVYRLAGQPARAQTACAEALRLDPNYAEAKDLQGKIEKDLKPK